MSINKKSKSVFSTVINDLVRSAIGEKARQVPDQDLDSYVTELITNEARAKQAKYKTEGVRAYQPTPPSSNPLKPNKRFLMNIMKQTDSHNQAVIREAEENARAFQERLQQKQALKTHNKGKGRHDDDFDTLKRKRKHEYDDDTSGSTTSEDTDGESSNSEKDSPQIQYRGRGKVRNGSSMDKYFDDQYDATKDVDSDMDTPTTTTKIKKKKNKKSHHKHHNKTKKKKQRHRSSKKAKKDH